MQTARLNQRTPFLGRVDVVPHVGVSRLTAWGQDVSETGMFLQSTEAFAVGDSLSVRFEVDGLEVHVRAASVVWVRHVESVSSDGRSAGIGIRFVSIDPPARAALRRLTALSAANDTMVHTDVSGLPKPTLTLPPLSRSILRAAGGRDLDDTQDLLPSSSLPRHTDEAISLPPLHFTAIPQPSLSMLPTSPPTIPSMLSAPIKSPLPKEMSASDDANLSSESRVFAGVPATPRDISMPPRVRTRPPTSLPTLSLVPTTSKSPVTTSAPAINVTQPLHSLPPVDVVDVFAGWTFTKVEQSVVAATVDVAFEEATTLPPIDADVVSALQQQLQDEDDEERAAVASLGKSFGTSPGTSDNDITGDGDDNDDSSAFEGLAAGAPSLTPTFFNPSILEATTLPPARDPRDDLSLSGAVDLAFFGGDSAAEAPVRASLDDTGAYSLGPTLVTTMPPIPMTVSPSPSRDEPTVAVRVPTSGRGAHRAPPRRSLQLAAVVLAAGCAAGAAVGVLSRAAQRPAPTSSPTVAAVAEAVVAPVVLPVAEAEAELYGRQPKVAAAVVAAASADNAAPVAVVAAASADNAAPVAVVAAASADKAAPVAVVAAASADKAAPVAVVAATPVAAPAADKMAPAVVDGKAASAVIAEKASEKVAVVAVVAPKLVEEPSHVAVVAPAKKAPLVAKPGRLEVDLPTGGRVQKVFALGAPARLVIDLKEAKLPGAAIDVDEAGMLQLRFGKPDVNTQRVVIVLVGDNKPDAVEARLQGDRLVATWQR